MDGRNAALTSPDDPAAAARSLRLLIADEKLAEALASGARQTAEGLTWRRRARRLITQIELWLHEPSNNSNQATDRFRIAGA